MTVTSSALTKSVLSVAAYRGVGGAHTAVSASASNVVNSAGTSHTTPAVNVSTAGSWLVNYWGEKSSNDTTWSAPASSASRTTGAATGSGKTSSLLADSNGPVQTGTAAGRTATTSASAGRSVLFSLVIAPQ